VVRLTVEAGTAILAVEAADDAGATEGCGSEIRPAGNGNPEPSEEGAPANAGRWSESIAETARGALAAIRGEVRLRPPVDDAYGDPSPAGVEIRLPVWTG
jgi:hypothetical protein